MLSRHINYFLAVAEHGSFTRAASALHVSQPALSQQIRQLEESLGVPLFDRSGRTIRLTDAGKSGDSTPAGRYRNWERVNGRFMMLPI